MAHFFLLIRLITNFLLVIKYSHISNKFFKNKSFNSFLRKNPIAWKNIHLSNNYIACDCTNYNPMNLIINLVNAKFLQKIYKCKLLIIDNYPNKYRKSLYESFLSDKIIYLYDLKSIFETSNFKEYLKISRADNIEDFLKINFDYFSIGKVSYDMYLRKSFAGTAKKITNQMQFEILNSIYICKRINKLLKDYNIKAYTTHEIQFNPEAYLIQYFLKKNINVFCKSIGQTSISIRKYNKLYDSFTPRQNITKNLFLKIKKIFPEKAQIGKQLIEDRFSITYNEFEEVPDTKFAFKKTHKSYSKKELCNKYNWDEKKPLILVLSNNIYDGVFEKRRSIFIDNYTWLKDTLKLLSSNNKINVLVKKHPTENYVQGVKDKTVEILKNFTNNKNIKLYPDNLSLNSIKNYLDVVFTDHGSAGVEYSNFGIPVVTSSDSRYSCANFVNECKNLEQYKKTIKDVHNLKKLSMEAINNARIFVFINQILTKVYFPLNPKINTYSKNFDYSFWDKLDKIINNFKFEESEFYIMIEKMIKKNSYNLINYKLIDNNEKFF